MEIFNFWKKMQIQDITQLTSEVFIRYYMQLLTWSSAFKDKFPDKGAGTTKWALFDPASNSVGPEQTSFTDHDMFCPSISMLGDGSIVVGGGNNAEATSIYVDGTGFEKAAQMNIPRGYSSSVTLSDGKVRAAVCAVLRCFVCVCVFL